MTAQHSETENDTYSQRARWVDEAITSRKSARAFLPTPIAKETIEHILEVSSRAPSGTNTQPWRVYVLTGPALQRFTQHITAIYLEAAGQHSNEKPYYPTPFPEPYLSRRRKIGWDLYGLLGIGRGDKDKMKQQHARNFCFFDAPVGMIITTERAMEIGSWLDIGMFLQNITIAARGHGLHTCPQAAWAQFHQPIREQLNIADSEMIVCGMALGYIDENALVNTLQTERAPLSEFTQFVED